MIRLDMSEFQSLSDIARLIGATSPVEMQGFNDSCQANPVFFSFAGRN